jgi:hypothetical protein
MIKLYSRIALFTSIGTGVLCFLSFNYHIDFTLYKVSKWLDIIAIFLLFILIVRALIRWVAVFRIKNTTGLLLSKKGWIKSFTYESVLWVFNLLIVLFMALYIEVGFLFKVVLLLYVIESLFHLLIGKSNYKIVISKNAITLVNHALLVISWNDIVTITLRHNDLQFKLKNNKVRLIDLDLISEKDKQSFESKIKENAFQRNIYFSS